MYRRSLTRIQRARLWGEQEMRCTYCEDSLELENLIVDHFHPWSDGGHNRKDNLRISCKLCNNAKGSKVFEDYEQARVYIRNKRNLPPVQETVYSFTELAAVVLPEMQADELATKTTAEKADEYLSRVFGR